MGWRGFAKRKQFCFGLGASVEYRVAVLVLHVRMLGDNSGWSSLRGQESLTDCNHLSVRYSLGVGEIVCLTIQEGGPVAFDCGAELLGQVASERNGCQLWLFEWCLAEDHSRYGSRHVDQSRRVPHGVIGGQGRYRRLV